MYVSLFRLGSGSHAVAAGASNGAAVLHAYVQHTFGSLGSGFLAVLISLACLVTAVGLTCACAEYFAKVLPLSYRTLVIILAVFSLLVSNLGLTRLIQFSIPVLTAIYPPCIVLVALSFCKGLWQSQGRVVAPVMLVSFVFGLIDALKGAGFGEYLPGALTSMPLSDQGLAWLVPSVITLAGAVVIDRVMGKRSEALA